MIPPDLSTPTLASGHGLNITFPASIDSSPSTVSSSLRTPPDESTSTCPTLVRRSRVRTHSTASRMPSTHSQIIRRSRSAGESLLPQEKERERREQEEEQEQGYADELDYDREEEEEDYAGESSRPYTGWRNDRPYQPHPYQHRHQQSIPMFNPPIPSGPNAVCRQAPQPQFRQPPTPQLAPSRSDQYQQRSRAQTHQVLQQTDGSHFLALTPHGRSLGVGSPITHQPSPLAPPRPTSHVYPMTDGPYPTNLPQSVVNNPYPFDDPVLPRPRPRQRALSTGGLERAGTLLSHGLGREQNARELKRILGQGGEGGHGRGLKSKEGKGKEGEVRLEAGKKKGRVEIDVSLERDVMVEGCEVKGRMEVKVREWNKKEGDVYVGGGKVRIVGFEDVPNHQSRHIFYHHSFTLPLFEPNTSHRSSLFDSAPDVEAGISSPSTSSSGFRLAHAGNHSIPFTLPLPITNFPKGPFRSQQGSLKYILIASLKLYFPSAAVSSSSGPGAVDKKQKSIAHFYRHVTVYPFLEMGKVLRNWEAPIEARKEEKMGGFLGGNGQVEMRVRAARKTWVAGQQVWVDVSLRNESSKKIKSLTVSLSQVTTFFHPTPHVAINSNSADADHDAVQTASKRRKIAESTLEAGQEGGKGYVTGKGWWKGCDEKGKGSWSMGLLLPPDAISIARGRLIEVSYILRVTANNSLFAEIPIKIINFISIDPPPSSTRPEPRPASIHQPIAVPTLNRTSVPPQSKATEPAPSIEVQPRPRSAASSRSREERLHKTRSMGEIRNQQEPFDEPVYDSVKARASPSNNLRRLGISPTPPVVASEENRGLLTHRASMAFIKTTLDAAAADDDDSDPDSDIDLTSEPPVRRMFRIANPDASEQEDDKEEEMGMMEAQTDYDDGHSFRDLDAETEQQPFYYDSTSAIDVGEGTLDDLVLGAPVDLDAPRDSDGGEKVDRSERTVEHEEPKLLADEEELGEGIGNAMQSMLVGSDSEDGDSDDEILKLSPRYPIPSGSTYREHAASSPQPPTPMERTGSDLSSAIQRSMSHAVDEAADKPSPFLKPGPTHDEPMARPFPLTNRASATPVNNSHRLSQPAILAKASASSLADLQRSRTSAVPPAQRRRIPSPSLSISPQLVHPIVREQTPRSSAAYAVPSHRPSNASAIPPQPPINTNLSGNDSAPSSPKVVRKKSSFSFASPAAPIRIKDRVASPASPARVRPATSAGNLRAKAALPLSSSSTLPPLPSSPSSNAYTHTRPLSFARPSSPVKVQNTTAALLCSPSKRASVASIPHSSSAMGLFASADGQSALPPSPFGARAKPGGARAAALVGSSPELTYDSSSSSSRHSSDVPHNYPSLAPSSPPKLSFTAKHLSSQNFRSLDSPSSDFAFSPRFPSSQQRSHSVDYDSSQGQPLPATSPTKQRMSTQTEPPSYASPSRSRTTMARTSSHLPSVKQKITLLETRSHALRELTSPLTPSSSNSSPALRRSATTAPINKHQTLDEDSEEISFPTSSVSGHFSPGWGAYVQPRSGTDLTRKDSERSVDSFGEGGGAASRYGTVKSGKGLNRAPSAVSFRAPIFRDLQGGGARKE